LISKWRIDLLVLSTKGFKEITWKLSSDINVNLLDDEKTVTLTSKLVCFIYRCSTVMVWDVQQNKSSKIKYSIINELFVFCSLFISNCYLHIRLYELRLQRLCYSNVLAQKFKVSQDKSALQRYSELLYTFSSIFYQVFELHPNVRWICES